MCSSRQSIKINHQIKVLGTALLGTCMKGQEHDHDRKAVVLTRRLPIIGGAISTLIASRNGLHRSLKFCEMQIHSLK
jgi:hypothetical protein